MSEARATRRARNREYAEKNRNERPSARWYNSRRWKLKRAAQLRKEPTCIFCWALGKTRKASVADHVIPHRDDPKLFWGGRLQSLCGPCHSSTKQRDELTGYSRAPDAATGWPRDAGHPFRQHEGQDGGANKQERKAKRPRPRGETISRGPYG